MRCQSAASSHAAIPTHTTSPIVSSPRTSPPVAAQAPRRPSPCPTRPSRRPRPRSPPGSAKRSRDRRRRDAERPRAPPRRVGGCRRAHRHVPPSRARASIVRGRRRHRGAGPPPARASPRSPRRGRTRRWTPWRATARRPPRAELHRPGGSRRRRVACGRSHRRSRASTTARDRVPRGPPVPEPTPAPPRTRREPPRPVAARECVVPAGERICRRGHDRSMMRPSQTSLLRPPSGARRS